MAYVAAIEVAGQRIVLVDIFKGTAQGLEKIFVYHLTRKYRPFLEKIRRTNSQE
jgi:hypothetical protein